jgi:hypothetical protein
VFPSSDHLKICWFCWSFNAITSLLINTGSRLSSFISVNDSVLRVGVMMFAMDVNPGDAFSVAIS